MLNTFRVTVFITTLVLLSSCSSTPPSEIPEIKSQMNQAQVKLNQCLMNQLSSLTTHSPTPELAVKVAATRCQNTAYKEASKLNQLDPNKGYGDELATVLLGVPNASRSYNDFVQHFTDKLTSKQSIEARAENILLLILENQN